MLNFSNGDTEFPVPNSATRAWSAGSEKKKKIDKLIVAMPLPKQEKKKFVTIVAMALPKMGGKKKWVRNLGRVKKKCYVHNIFTINHM